MTVRAVDVSSSPFEDDVAQSSSAAELARRRLTPKQALLIHRLIEAAADEAREFGYEGTTVRSAAKRAGVAPATAYSYFASKDHLLAEVLWQKMDALPTAINGLGAGTLERVTSELEVLGLFMADDPTLAAACTMALLGAGPEVRSLRLRFGAAVNSRLAAALGNSVDPGVSQGLNLAYSGAMLWAGMGHLSFSEVPDVLAAVARQFLQGST